MASTTCVCATCKTSKYIITHLYETVCTNCGLVADADYLDRSLDDYNHVTQQMFIDIKIIPDVSSTLAHLIWEQCPDTVLQTSDELFSDFCEINQQGFKGNRRESAIYASIYHSQNIMNIGVRSKNWFDDKMVDKTQFTELTSKFAKFIESEAKWHHLLTRKRHTLDDNIQELLSEFDIHNSRWRDVRKRAYILQDKVTSNLQIRRELDGTKSSNLHASYVYIACKTLKIDFTNPKTVTISTINKIVKILSKL